MCFDLCALSNREGIYKIKVGKIVICLVNTLRTKKLYCKF